MKIRNFWLISLLICSTALMAQPTKGHRNHANKDRTQVGLRSLGLDSLQRATLQQFNKVLRENLLKLKTETETPNSEAICDVLENHHQAVLGILDNNQKEKFSEILEKIEDKHGDVVERKESLKAMMEELKSYRETNITPVMRDLRMQLEQKISAEDKVKIDTLRAQHKSRPDRQADRKEHQQLDCSPLHLVYLRNRRPMPNRPRVAEGQRKSGKEQFGNRELAMVLTKQYSNEIESLFATISDQQNTWAEDIKAIKEKYLPDRDQKPDINPHNRNNRGTKFQNHRKQAHRKHASGGEKKADRSKNMRYLKFLLMRADQKVELNQAGSASTIIKVFPSPAEYAHRIEFTVVKAGKIQISLMDRSGRVLKTVVNKNMLPGKYHQEVNFQGLNDVMYFYSVQDSDGISTVKFVKSK